MKKIILCLLIAVSGKLYAQKFEGLALTPPMGWNSWNTFQTNISEKMVMETADMMVSSGMKDAGYTYLVLDDGWMAMERNKEGYLVPDPKKFPNGIKVVADYVHAKGLKFGLYNCAGTKTCAGYPGTRGYEYQDARQYAAWEIDYLKFDWCYTNGMNQKEAYNTMSRALQAAGRPIIFSLCEWGSGKPWEWAANVGQLWRSTGDIGSVFDAAKTNSSGWTPNSVMKIADLQDGLRKYAGPGHWNDPDMLEVGNGMTAGEDRVHFTLWSMMAAPLIAGNDIRKMSKETLAVLTDKDVVALDQDALGMQGFRYADSDSLETWVKPLNGGDWAVCFVNRSGKTANIDYNWKRELVINDTLSKSTINANEIKYAIRNLWTKKSMGNTSSAFRAAVPSHDVVLLKLSK